MKRRKTLQRKNTSKFNNKLAIFAGAFILLLMLPVILLVAQKKQQSNTNAQTTNGIVTRNGKTLMLNGQPYQFTGFNAFGLSGCEGVTYSAADLDAYFSSLQPYSMTRMWATPPWGIQAIDTIVAAAERNNQFLIMSLADGRAQCNDSDGANGGDGSGKSAAWYQGGYKTNYIPWVQQVVTKYKNSKAIGMWELLNEPGYDVNDTVMKTFFDDAAATIKAIDPNHLVESGSLAQYVEGTTDFAFVHGGPNIDVASLHEYDYDSSGKAIESGHFQPALDAMNSINKPLIIGEVGINAASSGCTSLQERSDAFKQKFDLYLSKGAAGVVIWNWSKEDHSNECNWWVGPNEPLIAMMKAYKVPGGAAPNVPPAGGTSTAPIQPTFGVVAPCPSCVSPTTAGVRGTNPLPTTVPIAPSSGSTNPAPTQIVQNPIVQNPNTPPSGETPGRKHANNPGGLQGFIALILAFLMQLLSILFGNK